MLDVAEDQALLSKCCSTYNHRSCCRNASFYQLKLGLVLLKSMLLLSKCCSICNLRLWYKRTSFISLNIRHDATEEHDLLSMYCNTYNLSCTIEKNPLCPKRTGLILSKSKFYCVNVVVLSILDHAVEE